MIVRRGRTPSLSVHRRGSDASESRRTRRSRQRPHAPGIRGESHRFARAARPRQAAPGKPVPEKAASLRFRHWGRRLSPRGQRPRAGRSCRRARAAGLMGNAPALSMATSSLTVPPIWLSGAIGVQAAFPGSARSTWNASQPASPLPLHLRQIALDIPTVLGVPF
jgi:hypothetical protein